MCFKYSIEINLGGYSHRNQTKQQQTGYKN